MSSGKFLAQTFEINGVCRVLNAVLVQGKFKGKFGEEESERLRDPGAEIEVGGIAEIEGKDEASDKESDCEEVGDAEENDDEGEEEGRNDDDDGDNDDAEEKGATLGGDKNSPVEVVPKSDSGVRIAVGNS